MKSTILTIAVALIAGIAFAADDKKPTKPEKGKGDPAARAEKMMKAVDKDSDGKISKDEFAASRMGKKAKEKGDVDKLFGRMDANGDGSITKDELGKKGGKGGKGKAGGDKKPKAE